MRKPSVALVWAGILCCLPVSAWSMGKLPVVVKVGSAPPEFSLQKEDGSALPFVDFRKAAPNKILVVLFLSYECPLSRLVVKSATQFLESNSKKVAAVGISPMPYETEKLLALYKKEHAVSFDLYLDKSGEITTLFHVKEVPVFFVFDQKGVLRFRGEVGGMKNAVLALSQDQGGFENETLALGCEVPKRKIKLVKKNKVKKEVPQTTPAPLPEEKSKFLLDSISQLNLFQHKENGTV